MATDKPIPASPSSLPRLWLVAVEAGGIGGAIIACGFMVLSSLIGDAPRPHIGVVFAMLPIMLLAGLFWGALLAATSGWLWIILQNKFRFGFLSDVLICLIFTFCGTWLLIGRYDDWSERSLIIFSGLTLFAAATSAYCFRQFAKMPISLQWRDIQ